MDVCGLGVVGPQSLDALAEHLGGICAGVLLGFHRGEDYGMVSCEAGGVIILPGFDALGQEVIAEGLDNALRVKLFVLHPADALVEGLGICFSGEGSEGSDGFLDGGGVFQHGGDPGSVIVNSAGNLAMRLSMTHEGEKDCG